MPGDDRRSKFTGVFGLGDDELLASVEIPAVDALDEARPAIGLGPDRNAGFDADNGSLVTIT